MNLQAMRAAKYRAMGGKARARVGGQSSLMKEFGCSDTDASEANKLACKKMITESIAKWVGSFGPQGDATSWKKAFLDRATTDGNGTYWYSKTFQGLLSELGACPPSGLASGPDCEAAGVLLVQAFSGVQTDADGQFRAYWPDFLIKMNAPKLKPLPEDTGPVDAGWIGRPAYRGEAEKIWRIALGKIPPIPVPKSAPAPGSPAPAPAPGSDSGGPVEYKKQEDLTTVVDRMIRAIYDFVTHDQYDLEKEAFSDDPFSKEFAKYGDGGSSCLDRSNLAMLLSDAQGTALAWRGEFIPTKDDDGSDTSLTNIADQILAKFDTNKDGCLSPEEFVASLKSIEKAPFITLTYKTDPKPNLLLTYMPDKPPRPEPFVFKSGPSADLSTAKKAGLAVGVPAVMGGIIAVKYGWLGFATGGVLGLLGIGATAWTLHRVKTRAMVDGKTVDKKTIGLHDVKEQPMADNVSASYGLLGNPEVFAVHMNMLAGQLEAAGYDRAAKEAREAASATGK